MMKMRPQKKRHRYFQKYLLTALRCFKGRWFWRSYEFPMRVGVCGDLLPCRVVAEDRVACTNAGPVWVWRPGWVFIWPLVQIFLVKPPETLILRPERWQSG